MPAVAIHTVFPSRNFRAGLLGRCSNPDSGQWFGNAQDPSQYSGNSK